MSIEFINNFIMINAYIIKMLKILHIPKYIDVEMLNML